MKRLLDQMTNYRDYLKEMVSKVSIRLLWNRLLTCFQEKLSIVDVTEETQCLEEIETMIQELKNDIKEEGFDHINMQLLHPDTGINPDEMKVQTQAQYAKDIEQTVSDIQTKNESGNGQNQDENVFQLVSNGAEEEFENLTRLDLLDKRLDKIITFLGRDELYAPENKAGNVVEEVSYWYNLAAILDKTGLADLEAKLQFLDKELDNVTKEKRMNHLSKEQKEEVSILI